MDNNLLKILEVKKQAKIDSENIYYIDTPNDEVIEIGKKNLEQLKYDKVLSKFYLTDLLFPNDELFIQEFEKYKEITKMAKAYNVSYIYVSLKLTELKMMEENNINLDKKQK